MIKAQSLSVTLYFPFHSKQKLQRLQHFVWSLSWISCLLRTEQFAGAPAAVVLVTSSSHCGGKRGLSWAGEKWRWYPPSALSWQSRCQSFYNLNCLGRGGSLIYQQTLDKLSLWGQRLYQWPQGSGEWHRSLKHGITHCRELWLQVIKRS